MSLPTTPVFPAGVALLGLFVLYRVVVYPLFVSPLRHIPGPKVAAITSLWLNTKYWAEVGSPLVKALHDKYGPVVRVGPNEVVSNDPAHVSVIYGVRSTFPKTTAADLFENYGVGNTFSSKSRETHKERRKRMNKVYTMTAQLGNTPLMAWVQNRLDKALSIIDSRPGEPVDIYTLATHFALDNVSFMVYGTSLHLLDGANLAFTNNIRELTISSLPFVRFTWLVNLLSTWPLSFFLPAFLKRAVVAKDSLEAMNCEKIDEANGRGKKLSATETLIGCMQALPEFGDTVTDGHVKSECFDHILAGADSTAAGLTYLIYMLALPECKKYQDRAREEVSKLPFPMDIKQICSLPYLEKCVLEALRLNPPAPGVMQQRTTPANEPTVLVSAGRSYILPPETCVSVQAYSLHRNEDVFGPSPDQFRLERWESEDEAQLRVMKASWIPFGSGARTCVGQHLAIIELKVILAGILRGHTVELPPNSNPDDMAPCYAAVIRPKAERCNLIFRNLVPSS